MFQEKTIGGEDEDFEQKLHRLRARIDLFPPEHKPHLVELADAIGRAHRKAEEARPSHHGS
jgi:hypothetical protein